MTFYECFNEKKDALAAQLGDAKNAAKTQKLLSDFFDTLLYTYNESCGLDALRAGAACMTTAVKAAFPLLECVSDVKVWETDAKMQREKGRPKLAGTLLLLLGLLAAAGAALAYIMSQPDKDIAQYRVGLCILAAGCALLAAGGALLAKKPAEQKERRTTVAINAPDLVRRLTAVVLQMDKNLAVIEADEANKRSAAESKLTPQQTELFAQLLEGKYSGSDEIARESLDDVERYLHNAGIDVENYTGDNELHFDLLPSAEGAGTLRPALLLDGRVLKKGLATQAAEVK